VDIFLVQQLFSVYQLPTPAFHPLSLPDALPISLRDDIYLSLRAITLDALRISDPGDPVEVKIGQWEKANSSRLARAREALDDIARVGRLDLATLSVATRQLRSMAR